MASLPNASAATIGDALPDAYESNSGDCSGFVRAVALRLGFVLTGNADAIVDALRRNWRELDDVPRVLREVRAGKFVIAGLKSSEHTPKKDHGHVVVVVDGLLYRGEYPRCWSGSAKSIARSDGAKSVGEIWNQTDRDNLSYFEPR